jgi:hypothetical protein
MPFLRSHYGESELTLRSTRKYAAVSSPVPCQVANFLIQMKQEPQNQHGTSNSEFPGMKWLNRVGKS